MEIISKYFNDFTPKQIEQFAMLEQLYKEWNSKINVISRKDIDTLYTKHVLHSLSIAARFNFTASQKVIDIGTGGGFPGIPLAIFFPETQFVLVDSIRKKMTVVESVVEALDLKNVTTFCGRAESYKPIRSFDFVVSRAVAPLADLWRWAFPLLRKGQQGDFANGLICLKGGDLHQEISESNCRPTIWKVEDFFQEPAFEEKYLLYVAR